MAKGISVSVRQIGTGRPLETAETALIGVDKIQNVWPTQPQSGGANFDRFLTDPATKAAVYARIDVDNGIGKQPTFTYVSQTVAAILTLMNAGEV